MKLTPTTGAFIEMIPRVGEWPRRGVLSGLLSVSLLFAAVAWPERATAETIVQMLSRACPNGQALKAAAEAAEESNAVDDPGARELSREAARQYYRCAHVTDNAYIHDWARLLYFEALIDSFAKKIDVKLTASQC